MQETTSAKAGSIREGMGVFCCDGRWLGAVERVGAGAFFVAGRRVTFDAVGRIEAGTVHLWGDSATYLASDAGDGAAAQRERNKGLPHTDEPLHLNERDVEASLEERLPRDGQR
jgi:hypothetical protein